MENRWERLHVDGISIKWNKLVSGCHFSVKYNVRLHNLYFVLCRESKNVFREFYLICNSESLNCIYCNTR